jgi:NAD(P)-dependent dehydrogenase (short-subunit alcohol dehydrogenase family)
MQTPLAIITGGSRGLGFETARQLGALGHRLVIAAKNKKGVIAAAMMLKDHGHDVHPRVLDFGSAHSIAGFGEWAKSLGPVDVPVNAAGILPESGDKATVLGADEREVLDTISVNAIGPWRLCQAIVPLMTDGGRIVNVSSGMGGLTDMGKGYFGYRSSKAMLNVLTRTLAAELRSRGILVNSVCPGWVRTDMGGPNATRSVIDGASGIVWAATLPPDGPTGGFFRDGLPIAW